MAASSDSSSTNAVLAKDLARQISLVPLPRKTNLSKRVIIPAALKLNDVSRTVIQAHVDAVEIDYHFFAHNAAAQGTRHLYKR